MNDQQALATRFEQDRRHLRAVAYRLLGSVHDADDAVQSAWLKISRRGIADVGNPTGWFTTVTAHECLDRLREQKRRAEVFGADELLPTAASPAADEEVAMAESVGRALLVVLDRLSPAQRVAFVLHDAFAMPFDDIAALLDRTPAAAKKLASRARERVHGLPSTARRPTGEHLAIARAFLAASQRGDLEALLEILDPDVVRRVDRVLVAEHIPTELRGAREFVEESKMFTAVARGGEVAVLDGAAGIVIAPAGQLKSLLRLDVRDGRITVIDIIGDPDRLASVDVTLAD
ncbi:MULTISPECIES: sigma-70 family RNA polymerase sigma factor [unclassified Mycolicibacterium]|uniref:sigma-70 family RNA polymerase sigma factor n=1 Tax=unclassified Mycolicibacterium TaxID=2636767 RepID=UPI0012DD4E62|nr:MULTISPECIES: sigma-70 family RNA polymerase sigma factor [unclassified Mycolicibacterium]MUL81246.1 sigma-70 family RNA polymerase sigma factor [Mycolicibacterium sp. CBMA 329]MUL87012.1 sigma-70 family RNA polymerase sigma factor [Mycolicibacterium sp. CBMA 331]MUL98705.1 sigma-70 family RNA polymerase sigma factor [Mycolicibacterium sp. CBMA 334]MUM25568.1 sigma-70 family RNA polymerase sigma factor [Mycolicibacterium sp. CBMA 295]MUM37309.1 sigma-70 family RNA polymerase sigma factor [M